ncbi:hypothetical protein [Vagococcus sp.]|uniref:hypothetical protein n=1 Tax=Vagococcus sp. TaxID=1933889 RepID=UPI003F9EA25C
MDKNQVKKNIEIQVDSNVFEQAEYIASKLGLNIEEVIASMITRVVALKEIPFALSLTEEEKEEIRSRFS